MASWLEEQRERRREKVALDAYLSRVTPIIRSSVLRYAWCLGRLDERSGGILSDPKTVERLNLRLPPGVVLREYFERIGKELTEWLTDLRDGPADRAIATWQRLLGDAGEYQRFMTRLIHTFGNYEVIALALPGMGPIITDHRLQAILGEMFAIKRRLIRLLELAYSIHRAWQTDPPCSSLGFFNPEIDMSRLVRGMLADYMIQADPHRIQVARSEAEGAGRRYAAYRFWRPAEALRQMADVEYVGGSRRVPKPRKHYVDLRVAQVPSICADLTRLAWAIKELFNNAIAATTDVRISDDGRELVARPIPKFDCPNPPPAITLTVAPIRPGRRWRSARGVRLIIADGGVGIEDDVLEHVTLWAFSTHRDWIDSDVDDIIDTPSIESKQMLIGGKGIGLAFARATILELGGDLRVESRRGQGTQVTIDLPTPIAY
ncbi:MAG: ATP-binding protein [Phycisphaerae bacterium]|nr:ATP-binding protein [Phycisphaerae bacterium]